MGGIAVGAFSVAIPPYVADIGETHLVPSLANFFHVQFSGGILFGYIIGKFAYMMVSTLFLHNINCENGRNGFDY